MSADGERIRANQGHSLAVDLGLTPVVPPSALYHGTAERFLESIRAHGLLRTGRQHVHLSGDPDTARSVGRRYGKPVVLVVDAGRMREDGCAIDRAANGVWLTDAVLPRYLTFPAGARRR